MKQLTLQEQYNLIKEGKGHKDVFLKTAKSQFPNIVPNAATFEQASSLLKQRSVISEAIWGVATGKNTQPDWFSIFNESVNENYVASSQEEPVKNSDKKVSKQVEEDQEHNFDYKDPKNRDNVYGQDFLKGYYAEMKDPKNSEKTMDELLELVSKNLAKDCNYYVKDGQFGVKGLGYTEDTPGLGAGKEAKGKYKSSGYGDLKESIDNNPKSFKKGDEVVWDGQIYVVKDVLPNNEYKVRHPFFTSIILKVKGKELKPYIEDQYIRGMENSLRVLPKKQEEGMDPKPFDKEFSSSMDFEAMLDDLQEKYKVNDQTIDDFLETYDVYQEDATDPFTYIPAFEKFMGIKENKNDMIKLTDLLEGEYYMPETKTPKKKEEPKKKVKKSPISDRVKEIEEESMFNAMEGKIQAMAEEIEMRENKLAMIDENEDLQEFINPVRIKEMQKEIDELKKTKEKMEKEYEKKSKGRKPKEVIDEAEETEEETNVGGKALAKTFQGLGSYENFEKAWKELLRKGMEKKEENK